MSTIDILVPENDVRRIHVVAAERLREKGHDVILAGASASPASATLNHILFIERKFLGGCSDCLMAPAEGMPLASPRPGADLRIDLTGARTEIARPFLRPGFAGCDSLAEAARLLMLGQLPDVEITLDGERRIGHAAPMIESRLLITRGLNDVLARAMTLLVDTTERYLKSETTAPIGRPIGQEHDKTPTGGQMIAAYMLSAMPRQAAGALRRLGFNIHRWRVSYRFHNGLTVERTGRLAGEPWRNLPDDGERFYADPFPFEWNGRHFIFVEELPDKSENAFISVTEIFRDREPTTPRMVLEEPYHLSYPQVFEHDGEIWMLPEGGAGENLVLYRADPFPDRWVRDTVLIAGRQLFDATLLKHADRFWLFATERDGYGSASDMLVVFYAPTLRGPWTAHLNNPITIDRAAARPGGGFARVGNRIILPMQDGTQTYGGGLGLADLLELDETTVRLTRPVPLLTSKDQPCEGIHTLNSDSSVEVIDCIAPAPRGALRRIV